MNEPSKTLLDKMVREAYQTHKYFSKADVYGLCTHDIKHWYLSEKDTNYCISYLKQLIAENRR